MTQNYNDHVEFQIFTYFFLLFFLIRRCRELHPVLDVLPFQGWVVNSDFGGPNAFTPNQDGINDGFRPLLDCITASYNFEIYNRWGHRIFFTDQQQAAWNGTYLDAVAPVDVYFWRLQYSQLVSGVVQFFSKKGEVSLIR